MNTIVSIQILRAVAAVGVVISHFQFDHSRITGSSFGFPELLLGNAGVDLFFVISGFVMVYATERQFARPDGPLLFFAHRVIRIVPTYWLVTTIYVLIAVSVPILAASYSAETVATSFFFIPHLRAAGVIQPVVGQGWTLNYEMFFYVIFSFAVFGSRRTAVATASVTLIGFVVVGQLFAPLPLVLGFWSDPIILEFVFGMLIALAYREGMRLPKSAAFGFVIAGILLFLALPRYVSVDPALRAVTWGGPAALLMVGATLGGLSPSPEVQIWRALARIGDASYALYLFHSFPVRGVLHVADAIGVDLTKAFWPLLVVAAVFAIALALAIYSLFERPVTKALRDRLFIVSPNMNTRTS